MKKKLLAGLLTVAACFSLGSTSFAASTSITSPTSSSLEATQVITPYYWNDYLVDLDLSVGQSIYVTGYTFYYLVYDGSVSVTENGLITGLTPGFSVVAADIDNNDRLIYRITVK